MTSSPHFQLVGTHRVPQALACDPPFQFLLEAFEGRSRSAVEGGQKSSTWESRQKFLDLVNRKLPASDVGSLVQTINAAIFFYDRIPAVGAEDFLFLAALLQFLRDFRLISKGRFEAVSQEIQSRVKAKTGEFDSFLYQWHKGTEEEAFERNLVHAVEEVETMQRNRKEASKREAEVQERSREVEEAIKRTARIREVRADERRLPARAKLGPELKGRSLVRSDLNRLVVEERSLVHAIKEEAWKSRPINWLALGQESFYNELSQADYMNLADLWGEIEAEKELSEEFLTPPWSSMITE
jgi:hypothetical protein